MNRNELFYMLLAAMMLTGCGLLDVEPDTEARLPTQMYFAPDTVYVMVGDTFVVKPRFAPDSINNKSLYWASLDPDIVGLERDTLVAMQEGWGRVVAASVAASVLDTLDVCVMEPWTIPNSMYPYEMVVYADVSVYGQPLREDMLVAAFVGDVIRGVGQPIRVGPKTLYRIRIYNDAETPLDYAEVSFSFWLYDPRSLQRIRFPLVIPYTGETYGTPSEPLVLKIE